MSQAGDTSQMAAIGSRTDASLHSTARSGQSVSQENKVAGCMWLSSARLPAICDVSPASICSRSYCLSVVPLHPGDCVQKRAASLSDLETLSAVAGNSRTAPTLTVVQLAALNEIQVGLPRRQVSKRV
jgi:hypothetical protein